MENPANLSDDELQEILERSHGTTGDKILVLMEQDYRKKKHLAQLEALNAEQSEHISKLGKRIAELEEQANHREDTISFVRENLRATEAGIVDLENMLNRETATSGRWFAWHVAAAEEENEVIEKLEEEREKQGKQLAELEAVLQQRDMDLAQVEALVLSHEGHIETQDARIAELRESKDLCPVCLTWSWAPCDAGDEGAQPREEEWVLCQCCNDSRIAVLWKTRAEEVEAENVKLRDAGQALGTAIAEYMSFSGSGMTRTGIHLHTARQNMKAAVGEGGGG